MPRRERPTTRVSLRSSARHRRPSTPPPPPSISDDDTRDEESQVAESAPNEDADGDANEDADGEEDEDASSPSEPAEDVEVPVEAATPEPRHHAPRRRGRPPRALREGRPTPDRTGDDGSEGGTPARRARGRGRGGWRAGFRGRARRGAAGPSYSTRQPKDREGNVLDVVDDEVVIPEDPEGETKVDKDGVLQGGREYRVRTFTVIARENRLYMLSTEPARCTGFRDSYLFFNKHPHLYKIILDDEEKRDMIEREILPHSYKGRAIGVVTARSVYREFGSKIVVGGRKIIDDYRVADARARGDVEGELADPQDRLPIAGQSYNRNQFVAWHGASSVYHNKEQAASAAGLGKRRPAVTSVNWMLEHARVAAQFNSTLAAERRATLKGVYDPHTNIVCYPRVMQPTHVKWEQVDGDAPTAAKRRRLNEEPPLNGDVDPRENPNHINGGRISTPSQDTNDAGFENPSDVVIRNFAVVDTYFVNPPDPAFPLPGPRTRPPGLSMSDALDSTTDAEAAAYGIPTLDPSDLNSLSAETRVAYLKAKRMEQTWRGFWGNEASDGARGSPKILLA